MVDFYGEYEYVSDRFVGSPKNDSFYAGLGPALIQGLGGFDTAYVAYASSSIILGSDFQNGRMHFRVFSNNYVDEYYGIDLIGVERIVFSDGKSYDISPKKASKKFPVWPNEALIGEYEYLRDALIGMNVPTLFCPGSGDAIIGGNGLYDTLSIPVLEKGTSWNANRSGNGFVYFSDSNGDGSHSYSFTGIERIEFVDTAYQRNKGKKFKPVSIKKLV